MVKHGETWWTFEVSTFNFRLYWKLEAINTLKSKWTLKMWNLTESCQCATRVCLRQMTHQLVLAGRNCVKQWVFPESSAQHRKASSHKRGVPTIGGQRSSKNLHHTETRVGIGSQNRQNLAFSGRFLLLQLRFAWPAQGFWHVAKCVVGARLREDYITDGSLRLITSSCPLPVSQSVSQPGSQSVSQSVSPSGRQSVSQSDSQSCDRFPITGGQQAVLSYSPIVVLGRKLPPPPSAASMLCSNDTELTVFSHMIPLDSSFATELKGKTTIQIYPDLALSSRSCLGRLQSWASTLPSIRWIQRPSAGRDRTITLKAIEKHPRKHPRDIKKRYCI